MSQPRHGPLERGEGAQVPFRLGRTTEFGQGRGAFEHRQFAALLFLLVGFLEDPVEIPLGQRGLRLIQWRQARLVGPRSDLAVDQRFDLRQGELDQLRQLIEGALPRFFCRELLVGQQLLEEPLGELTIDLFDLPGLLAGGFRRDSFACLLGVLFLLSPLFDFLFRSRFLEGPLCGLLLQDDEAHRPQRGGDQDSDEDEPPAQTCR